MTAMTSEAQFWNKLAEGYAAQPIENVDAWQQKLRITKARCAPDHTVLDIGCGTGSLALELSPHCKRVHGLDVSQEMVRIARGKTTDQGIDNTTFHIGTLDDPLPFEPQTLDGVCAFSILHLVADRSGVLTKLFDLIKPGGFFVTSTVCLGNSWVPFVPIITVMRWLGKAPQVWSFSQDQLIDEMKATGFTDVEAIDVGAKSTVAFVVARKPA